MQGGYIDNEISDADSHAGWVKRKMIERCEESILLLDHSKLGIRLFNTVCSVSELNHIVLDRVPPHDFALSLHGADVQLHVAS